MPGPGLIPLAAEPLLAAVGDIAARKLKRPNLRQSYATRPTETSEERYWDLSYPWIFGLRRAPGSWGQCGTGPSPYEATGTTSPTCRRWWSSSPRLSVSLAARVLTLFRSGVSGVGKEQSSYSSARR